jgi:hypothetical protein
MAPTSRAPLSPRLALAAYAAILGGLTLLAALGGR